MKLIRLEQAYPIDRCKPHPHNARTHDIPQLRRLVKGLGQHRTIVVREATGEILAGNGWWEASKAEGRESIAVSLVKCSDREAVQVVLSDNRSQETGGYDSALLADLLKEADVGNYLDLVGYDQDYLDGLLAELAGPVELAGDPDDAPEPPEVPLTKPGDLWLLGEHRVLAGDACSREDVGRLMGDQRADLMLTDPPYGVAYQERGSEKKAIRGDLSQSAIPISFALAVEDALSDDARIYLFGGSGNWTMYARLFDHHLRMEVRPVVWIKENFVLRHNGYHSKFEMVYYGWKGAGGANERWYGDRKQVDVWEVARDRSGLHPTQKPVEVCSIPIRNSCPPEGLIYEPFAGSGSTLIAAHQEGRRCYAMELDPTYCDVILKRFETLTGITPRRESGEAVSFLEEVEADPALIR